LYWVGLVTFLQQLIEINNFKTVLKHNG